MSRVSTGDAEVATLLAERERLTEQLATAHRFDAAGRLAGGLAHDLNNLLAILSSTLDLADESVSVLERGDDRAGSTAALREELGLLRAASSRVDRLSRRLVQFAAPERRGTTTLDPGRCASELAPLLRRSLGPDATFELAIADDVPWVDVDPAGFEQAVTNLVLNARDAVAAAGRPGRVCLSVATDGHEWSGPRTVRVSVTDDGEGMSAAVLARAFEPLYTTKPPDHGSGLGLATVQAFVETAGGRVEVDTAPGEGCTVALVLPEQTSPRTDPHDVSAPLALLVGHTETTRRIIARMLDVAGYRVRDAADAPTALAALDAAGGDGAPVPGGEVAVLVSELALERTNGADLVRAARERAPDLAAVLLSTSAADVGEGPRGVAVLRTPFSSDRLRAAIDAARR